MRKASQESQSPIIGARFNSEEGLSSVFRALKLSPQIATARAQAAAESQARNGCLTPMPTVLWGLDRSAQLRLALPVLLAARSAILAGEEPLAAIADAGNGRIECEYARRALRIVLWHENLLVWQSCRSTSQSDRTRAIDKAIRLCKRVDGKKGGWRVSVAEERKHLKAAGVL